MWLRLLKISPSQFKNTRPNNPVQEVLEQLQLHRLYSTNLYCPTMWRIDIWIKEVASWIPIQSVDSLIKWVSLLSRRHSAYRAIFFVSHYGYIDIAINAIYLIPAGISNSVPTDIYFSTKDDSVDSSDPVNSSWSFVTENPDPSSNRYKPLVEDSTIHRITSKYLDNTTSSTAKESHNADTIRAQLDTGAKVSWSKFKYITHNFKPYPSKFWCPT